MLCSHSELEEKMREKDGARTPKRPKKQLTPQQRAMQIIATGWYVFYLAALIAVLVGFLKSSFWP